MNYIIYYHYRSDCHIKLSVVSAVAVKKIYLKSFNNLTSLSMGKPFFSVFGSVEKSILGHYRCLEFSKLSFFFLRMMNWMQVHVNTQFEDIWILFDVVFRVKTLKNSLKWPFFEVFFVTIFFGPFFGPKKCSVC